MQPALALWSLCSAKELPTVTCMIALPLSEIFVWHAFAACLVTLDLMWLQYTEADMLNIRPKINKIIQQHAIAQAPSRYKPPEQIQVRSCQCPHWPSFAVHIPPCICMLLLVETQGNDSLLMTATSLSRAITRRLATLQGTQQSQWSHGHPWTLHSSGQTDADIRS